MEEDHHPKLSSTLTRSSSFAEDCRDAHASAAKEFDQFYGYLANALSPRRSVGTTLFLSSGQRAWSNVWACWKKNDTKTDRSRIQKSSPRNSTRIRQDLNQRRTTSSSSLTPMMEQHSLLKESDNIQYRDSFEETGKSLKVIWPQTAQKHLIQF